MSNWYYFWGLQNAEKESNLRLGEGNLNFSPSIIAVVTLRNRLEALLKVFELHQGHIFFEALFEDLNPDRLRHYFKHFKNLCLVTFLFFHAGNVESFGGRIDCYRFFECEPVLWGSLPVCFFIIANNLRIFTLLGEARRRRKRIKLNFGTFQNEPFQIVLSDGCKLWGSIFDLDFLFTDHDHGNIAKIAKKIIYFNMGNWLVELKPSHSDILVLELSVFYFWQSRRAFGAVGAPFIRSVNWIFVQKRIDIRLYLGTHIQRESPNILIPHFIYVPG